MKQAEVSLIMTGFIKAMHQSTPVDHIKTCTTLDNMATLEPSKVPKESIKSKRISWH
jgi:hypothetical protein